MTEPDRTPEHAEREADGAPRPFGVVFDVECVGEFHDGVLYVAFRDLLSEGQSRLDKSIDIPSYALLPGMRLTVTNPLCPHCRRAQAEAHGRQGCLCGQHDWLDAANVRTAKLRSDAAKVGVTIPDFASAAKAPAAPVATVAGVAVAPAGDDVPDAAANAAA